MAGQTSSTTPKCDIGIDLASLVYLSICEVCARKVREADCLTHTISTTYIHADFMPGLS